MRRGTDVPVSTLVGVVALMINLAALVWGAAKISASVDELGRITGRLSVVADAVQKAQAEQDARIRVLEDRLPSRRESP